MPMQCTCIPMVSIYYLGIPYLNESFTKTKVKVKDLRVKVKDSSWDKLQQPTDSHYDQVNIFFHSYASIYELPFNTLFQSP